MRIGIDAGDTFTDFVVLHRSGRMETFKLRSNPKDPSTVILEGIARANGKVLAPKELRELLRKTGTPQAGDTKEHIGPRPDLERAIRAI